MKEKKPSMWVQIKTKLSKYLKKSEENIMHNQDNLTSIKIKSYYKNGGKV